MKKIHSLALTSAAIFDAAHYSMPASARERDDEFMHAPALCGVGENWAQYRVTDPNSQEELRQPLYDSVLYPLLGTQNLAFFTSAQGGGVTTAPGAIVGSPKTEQDTNLQVANTLPSGKEVLMECIEVTFFPGTSATANTFVPALSGTTDTAALAANYVDTTLDVQTFYESGVLRLRILDKDQLVFGPLRNFPPTNRLDLQAAVANSQYLQGAPSLTQTLLQHMSAMGVPFELDPYISLQPTANFKISLEWPGLVPMPSGKNGRVQVKVDGKMRRAAQ